MGNCNTDLLCPSRCALIFIFSCLLHYKQSKANRECNSKAGRQQGTFAFNETHFSLLTNGFETTFTSWQIFIRYQRTILRSTVFLSTGIVVGQCLKPVHKNLDREAELNEFKIVKWKECCNTEGIAKQYLHGRSIYGVAVHH